MNVLHKKIFQAEFSRNVITLMTGTGIAQVLPIAASPILTRLYTPANFGIFALYMTVVSLLSLGSTGRYQDAVVIAPTNQEAMNIMALTIALAVGFGIVILAALWTLKDPIVRLMGEPEISRWLYIVPLAIFSTGLFNAFTCWANRKKRYRKIAIRTISQGIVTAIASIVLGFTGLGPGGLIIGHVFGTGTAAVLLGREMWLEDGEKRNNVSLKGMLDGLKKHKDFPLCLTPTSFLNTASTQAPVMILAKFFDSTTTGFFGLTDKILRSPATLIGASVSQVYYQKMANLKQANADLKKHIVQLAGYMSLLSLIPLLILIPFGPSLFAFIFGEHWRDAGYFAQILAVPNSVKFVVSPLSTVLIVQNKIRTLSLWQIGYFVTTLAALIGASKCRINVLLYIYAAQQTLLYLLYFHLILKESNHV